MTSGDEGMLCTVCIAHPTHADRTSSLVKGCASYRREILTSHHSSLSHRRCMAVNQRVRQEQDAEPVQGPMDHQLRNMNAREVDTMVRLFNTAYFIVKEEAPFITYPKLVSLQLRNGAKMGGQYQNDNACRRFTKYLYNDVMSTTFNEITNCSMMGIMFDGATDKSVCEVELVYVRYVIDGQARNQYLRCQPIEHAHADGVFGAIDQAFRDVGVENWRSKVVGVGCDGASVNLGRNNSVATRITENMNYIVLMHCVAHRLELGIDFHIIRYISYSCDV